MKHLYGDFSDKQINETLVSMHNDIHKLLLFKDPNITETIFDSEDDFIKYFTNLLFRFGGLNDLLGKPAKMVDFMSTLQAAYEEVNKDYFIYKRFRKAILDCHGYLKEFSEGE